MEETSPEEFQNKAQEALDEAAAQMERTLVELAHRLRPFPAFLGMSSMQAMELEPPFAPARDLGCVVVDPEGRICQLDFRTVAGIEGVAEADHVEEFIPLDLSSLEYLVFAATAIGLLAEELRKRVR